MTTYLLAGGGTAGHVNPLLAVADTIRVHEPDAVIIVLGTSEGLEARLVPARGYELVVIPRVPFPRRPNRAAISFLPRFWGSVAQVAGILRQRKVDVVVGFGGYVSTPAYLAARKLRIPVVIHEANAKPGLANKLGARFTSHVGVAFAGTPLRHALVVGMPLRPEIVQLEPARARAGAEEFFGLRNDRPTLLVTGGSLGSRRLNATIVESAQAIIQAGWQIVHITGTRSEITDPQLPHYHLVSYCDRMDLALAAADFAVSRAGSGTVAELTALGIPALYVPYPVGNGEQRFNAAPVVAAGGGMLVEDSEFLPDWLSTTLLPVLSDRELLAAMGAEARAQGVRDGSERMLALIHQAL
jgi:UDP-N-acetylglucosamine--N-acetylmuramyl-(pentapeptide) pyrophosphoryl-undecaprenol N-acetylglucosamine transferase